MQHPPENTQVLAAAVLLEHSDLVPHAVQLRGETHTFAKVHHVNGHSALVDGAPSQWGVLDWRRKKKLFWFFLSVICCLCGKKELLSELCGEFFFLFRILIGK